MNGETAEILLYHPPCTFGGTLGPLHAELGTYTPGVLLTLNAFTMWTCSGGFMSDPFLTRLTPDLIRVLDSWCVNCGFRFVFLVLYATSQHKQCPLLPRQNPNNSQWIWLYMRGHCSRQLPARNRFGGYDIRHCSVRFGMEFWALRVRRLEGSHYRSRYGTNLWQSGERDPGKDRRSGP
jgi:hypothetical protein